MRSPEGRVKADGRLRVLQIVENLEGRAVESWLLRTFLHASREDPRIHWTFFCVLPQAGEFDDVVRRAGGEVIHSRYEVGDKIAFLSSLRRLMKRGRYDVVHCHHDIMSAAYLLASVGLPFSRRIVHLHNTALALPTNNPLKQLFYREPMRQVCLRLCDRIVGISKDALHSITGKDGERKGRDLVVHYGVETGRFKQPQVDRTEFRRQLGLPPEAKILLFVGRMVDYKNPCFVVEILEHLRILGENFAAVFVGGGELEAEVQRLAADKGLESRVRVTGFRRDVPGFMHASDVLIWPSLEEPKEGLGLGVVEAQAAGLPILMSQSVPDEAVVVPELSSVLPLAAGARRWAEEALRISRHVPLSRQEALARVEASSFSMTQGVANILALYRPLLDDRKSKPVRALTSSAFKGQG